MYPATQRELEEHEANAYTTDVFEPEEAPVPCEALQGCLRAAHAASPHHLCAHHELEAWQEELESRIEANRPLSDDAISAAVEVKVWNCLAMEEV